MADNFTTNAGSGGDTFAADDIGGIKFVRQKLVWGPDGTANDADVASGKPLPVQLRDASGTAVDFDGKTGSLTETAPTTDTASSGLNGRLQRIAQRLTSLISPGLSVAVSVTRPSDTTAYAANDVLGPTGGGTSGITFNLAAISGSNILITSAALERDVAAVISGETSYKLYLYNVTPPSALADNAAFDIPSGDRASFLGRIDLGTPADEGSTLFVEQNAINKQIKLSGTGVFGYLVTVGAYTPASATVLKVTLHGVQL